VIELGHAYNKELTLDRNNSTVLTIHNEIPLHVSYLSNREKIYFYAPIITNFVDHENVTLLRWLLKCAFVGRGFGGVGGVGIVPEKNYLMFHAEFFMESAPHHYLKTCSNVFVKLIKYLQEIVKDVSALEQGKEKEEEEKEEEDKIEFPCIALKAGKTAVIQAIGLAFGKKECKTIFAGKS